MKFNERKAAQMASYFLMRRGGKMAHLKLMKLLYLADRESMRLFAWPISGDRMVAMPHGPVLSMILDYMDGNIESLKGGWASLISAKENNEVSLRSEVSLADFDELSESDIEVLDSVWQRFGKWSRWRLRDYTHENCPEWTDPDGSSNPIGYKDVFIALGKTDEVAHELSGLIEEQHMMDKVFAQG